MAPTFIAITKSGWVLEGKFRVSGKHVGAIEWRFMKPKTTVWLPGSTALPAPISEEVSKAKDTVRAHFAKNPTGKAVMKAAKAAVKPAAMKATAAKKVKKAAMKGKK